MVVEVELDSLIDLNCGYMTIPEVAKLWNVPIESVRALGEEGLLDICIRKISVFIAIENLLEKNCPTDELPKIQKIKHLQQPPPLHPNDIYHIFSNPGKKVKITRFKTKKVLKLVKLRFPEIEVGFDDMIITVSEIKRIECKYKLRKKGYTEPFILKSPDYTIFELYGEEYSFGEKQAKVIKYLYESYKKGTPDVHGKTLLTIADSASEKLGNLFGKSSGYKKVIISLKHTGKYRINLPYEKKPSLYEDEDLPLFSYNKQ